jgi:hypothetical protein
MGIILKEIPNGFYNLVDSLVKLYLSIISGLDSIHELVY